MKTALVFDAGLLALHFAGDSRVRDYFDAVQNDRAIGLIAEVNLAEYYYKTCRKLGRDTADIRYLMIRASKLHAIHDEALIRQAGLERCRTRLDLSLADCFVLAVAKREQAVILTTDSELRKTKDVSVKFFKL